METSKKNGRDQFLTTRERFARIADTVRASDGRGFPPEIVTELFSLVPDLDSIPQKARTRVLFPA